MLLGKHKTFYICETSSNDKLSMNDVGLIEGSSVHSSCKPYRHSDLFYWL